MEFLSIKKIDDAYERIKNLVLKTPLVSNDQINKKLPNIFKNVKSELTIKIEEKYKKNIW